MSRGECQIEYLFVVVRREMPRKKKLAARSSRYPRCKTAYFGSMFPRRERPGWGFISLPPPLRPLPVWCSHETPLRCNPNNYRSDHRGFMRRGVMHFSERFGYLWEARRFNRF